MMTLTATIETVTWTAVAKTLDCLLACPLPLPSCCALFHHVVPLILTCANRLLSHQITTHVLNPSRLPALLRTVRVNLFPNNAMGQGKPPPANAEEVAAVKRKCAEEIRGLIPAAVRGVYFGKARDGMKQEEWEVQRVEEDVLGLLEDGYCNKHFLFAVIEVVLCRVFPELMQGKEG